MTLSYSVYSPALVYRARMPSVPRFTQSGMICSSWNALCRYMYRLKTFSTAPRSCARWARPRTAATSSRRVASSAWSSATDAAAMVSDIRVLLRGDGVLDGLAHEGVLLLDEVDRVGFAEIGERVALPLAGEVALVAAHDELAHDARDVHRRLLAVGADVVELRVHVEDLRHDVQPLLRRHESVHVESEARERAEAQRVDALAGQVVLELLVAHMHRRRLVPDLVHHGEVLLVHAHLPESAQQRRGKRVHRRAE